MRLTVLGRSPARPNPGEACAGHLVEGGGARILVDVGPGVVAQLLRRTTPDQLDAVVISHMHTDHCLDLITLRYSYPWIHEARARLKVVVPPGSLDQLADMARGAGYRDFFDRSFDFVEHDGTSPIAFGGLRITPVETKHFIPCWGFRMEADDRLLAYTADTAPCDALLELATDADLLLAEAALRTIEEDAPSEEERGHLLPAEAAAAAELGGTRRLVLTHLAVEDGGEWAQRTAAEVFSGDVEVAVPLKAYEL